MAVRTYEEAKAFLTEEKFQEAVKAAKVARIKEGQDGYSRVWAEYYDNRRQSEILIQSTSPSIQRRSPYGDSLPSSAEEPDPVTLRFQMLELD